MREILFRGKHKTNGAWVYGFYVHCADRWGRGEDLIQSVDIESGGFGLLHEVDPETVGQFTGLTDKNGKKIFEGDILQWVSPDGESGKVYVNFTRGVFGFQCVECPFAAPDLFADFEPSVLPLEVIGNIHDNPELLEGKR